MSKSVVSACRSIMYRRSTSAPPTNRLTTTDIETKRSLSRGSKIRSRSVDGRTNPMSIHMTENLVEHSKAYDELCEAPDDSKREWNKRMPGGHIVVYTDGSYKNGCSGFGIFLGSNHPLNRSQKILDPPHNSQRPEVLAVVQALKNILEWDGYRDEPVIIRTDSLNIINAINGTSTMPTYRQEIDEIKALASKISGSVKFQHVHAHDGDPGNEAADELARQAVIGPNRSRSKSRNRTRERGRSRSRENNSEHIRTHSAVIHGNSSTA